MFQASDLIKEETDELTLGGGDTSKDTFLDIVFSPLHERLSFLQWSTHMGDVVSSPLIVTVLPGDTRILVALRIARIVFTLP